MGRSKSKNPGRRGYIKTANVLTLPTRVPSLRVSYEKRRIRRFDGSTAHEWDNPYSLVHGDFNEQVNVPGRAKHHSKYRRNLRRPNLQLVEDRRQWHPDGRRRVATAFNKYASRIIVPGWVPLAGAAVTAKLAFAGPQSVAICVRRKMRREVMFARRKNGRRGQRRPSRSWYSTIKCRR